MGLRNLRDALLTVGVPVGHFDAPVKEAPYLVWAEDGQGDSVKADGETTEQAVEGTVDYFTPVEFDPNVPRTQEAMDASGAAWRLNSIQREEETGLIHYEWVFQVECF